MPVKLDGNCVVEPSGEVIKCHDTREEALAHMRAINANTEKEMMIKEIMADVLEATGRDANGIISRIADMLKKSTNSEPDSKFLLKKDKDGNWSWIARYSNNFRDEDNPPEIISAKSHRGFVSLVDEGLVDLPELWLWHVEEWAWGKATWVAYDDSGFALSGGYVYDDPACKELAERLAQREDLGVSHGMPIWSIIRSKEDPSVIVGHITKEVSPLPMWAAANKLTGFTILSKEKATMAVSQEKRNKLVAENLVDPELLDRVEARNAVQAAAALEEGKETKELESAEEEGAVTQVDEAAEAGANADVPVPEPEPEPVEQEPTEEDKSKRLDDIESAVVKSLELLTEIGKRFKEIDDRINQMEEATKELKRADEEKISKQVANTPLAGLASLAQMSVIGSEEARVDGRTRLAKDGPEEVRGEAPRRTPFGLVNSWLDGEKNEV